MIGVGTMYDNRDNHVYPLLRKDMPMILDQFSISFDDLPPAPAGCVNGHHGLWSSVLEKATIETLGAKFNQ